MIASFLDPAISVTLWIAIKASVLLGIAAIVQAVIYRRASAAMRHLVWTLAVIGVLLLPILSLVLPEWAVVTRTAATTAADASPAHRRVSPPATVQESTTLVPSKSNRNRTSSSPASLIACRRLLRSSA